MSQPTGTAGGRAVDARDDALAAIILRGGADEDSFSLDFSDQELSALLDALPMLDQDRRSLPEDVNTPAEVEASPELSDVTRRISSQYVEVMAMVLADVFASRAGAAALDQLETAAGSLRRLAEVAKADAEVTALDGLLEWVVGFREVLHAGRSRRRPLEQLHAWIERYSQMIEPGSARRLRELIEFDTETQPLLSALSGVEGVGPRRLQRLYAAGLFTVEALRDASPQDLAQVTGLPRAVAERVVQHTRTYAEERRTRCISALQARLSEFSRLWRELDPSADPALAAAARTTLDQMRRTLAELPQVRSTE